jgi:predicted lipase
MFLSWVTYKTVAYEPYCLRGLTYSEEDGFERLKGCGTWTIIQQFVFNDRVEHAHAIIAECVDKKQLIVAFRGTEFDMNNTQNTVNDWLFGCFDSFLVSWNESTDSGSVHRGFYHHYDCVVTGIHSVIEKHLQDGYTVIFAGHSQGNNRLFQSKQIINLYYYQVEHLLV